MFCKWYSSKSCCVPQQNDEISEHFDNILNLGRGCLRTNKEYDELRQWYCVTCSDKQAKYLRPIIKADASKEMELYVCEEFADKLFPKDKDKRMEKYDDCGLMFDPTDFGGECNIAEEEDGTGGFTPGGSDPFQCGDDLVLPGSAYDNATAFMMAYKPPVLVDWLEEDVSMKVYVMPTDLEAAKTPSFPGDIAKWSEIRSMGYECFNAGLSGSCPGTMTVLAIVMFTLGSMLCI